MKVDQDYLTDPKKQLNLHMAKPSTKEYYFQ